MTAETVRVPDGLTSLFAAFVAGFNASAEGWNGEFPFGDQGVDPGAELAPWFMAWMALYFDGTNDVR